MNYQQSKNWVQNSYSAGYNKFNVVLSGIDIANQVAQLLNINNNLTLNHTQNSIVSNQTQYFIEIHGSIVSGCVGLIREAKMDKIVHLSVLPAFRKMGIGKKLLLNAIDNSYKNIIYMHIRHDNVGSLSLAQSVGFIVTGYTPKF